MSHLINRFPCGDRIQLNYDSWGDLAARCTKPRGHAGSHEGPDDYGDHREWVDD